MTKQMSREDMVAQFHEAMGQAINAPFEADLLGLRLRLIAEESHELSEVGQEIQMDLLDGYDGPTPSQLSDFLKELADLQYVVSGLAVTFGLPLDAAFARVHRSNLSKLGEGGRPVYREDGKVMKGPNYEPPAMGDLFD